MVLEKRIIANGGDSVRQAYLHRLFSYMQSPGLRMSGDGILHHVTFNYGPHVFISLEHGMAAW